MIDNIFFLKRHSTSRLISVWPIASLLILSSEKSKYIFLRLTKVVVIKSSSTDSSLSDIVSCNAKSPDLEAKP